MKSKSNKVLKICYVDDYIDTYLSKYLDEYPNKFKNLEYTVETSEYTFLPEDNYKTLLLNQQITESAVLLVDSRLFQNMTKNTGKFTGEQFLVILKKVLPFIKTIIITQNEISRDSITIEKYKNEHRSAMESSEYYDSFLKPVLDQNLQEFIDEKEIFNEMIGSPEFDELLIETLSRSIDGLEENTIFEKEELDELINIFNEVRDQYEEN